MRAKVMFRGETRNEGGGRKEEGKGPGEGWGKRREAGAR